MCCIGIVAATGAQYNCTTLHNHFSLIYKTTLVLQSGCVAGVLGRLQRAIKIILCPDTQTQHVTDVHCMRHAMAVCGMRVLICDGHVVHKHGKGLWCSANMFVVRGMGLCAPKYAPMCTPPQVWCNMATICGAPVRRCPCPPPGPPARRFAPSRAACAPISPSGGPSEPI